MIGAAQSDFLCIEGVHDTSERASAVYGCYDATGALELAVADETHGFSPQLRESPVNWFRDHLADAPPTFETGDPATIDPTALHCTDEGEVLAAFPDERTVTDLNRAYVAERAPTIGAPSVDTDEDGGYDARSMRDAVIERFDLETEGQPCYPRAYEQETVDGVTWEKVFFLAERDPPTVVTGFVARDPDGPTNDQTPLVVLYDGGTDAVHHHVDELTDRVSEHGFVLALDPRGVGAVRPRNVNTPLMNGGEFGDYHGTENKLAADALMLGTSLVALQTYDVLRARDFLLERLGDSTDIAIEGHGSSAYHATLGAVAEPAVSELHLVDPIEPFHERATAREITVDHRLTVHGVVGTFDFPQLLPALANRTVCWTNADPERYHRTATDAEI